MRINFQNLTVVLAGVVVASCVLLSSSQSAQALTVTRTDEFNGTSELFYPASATDLINQGQSTLLSQTNDGNYTAQFGAGPTSKLNDGFLGTPSVTTDTVIDLAGTSFTTTFHLNTSVNTLGYQIDRIRTMAGWPGDRANQSYQVRYSTVTSNPSNDDVTGFVDLDGNPLAAGTKTINTNSLTGSLRITLDMTDLTNINAIQFVVDANATGRTSAVYREFDVFGSAVALPVPPVPEPSTAVLMGLGVLGMSVVRRRRAG